MLKVLGRRSSANVQKVLWCLTELGLAYEREDYGGPFGGTKDEGYLRLNPNGVVPTLVDGSVAVWESNTILRYLCSAYGSATLYPVEPALRSQAERWMDWQLSTLHPAFQPLFVGLVREQRPAAELEAARLRTAAQLRILDAAVAGHGFPAGDFGLADIALGPFVHRWLNLPIDHDPMPHLEAWHDRLCERPGFREHVMIGW